jgi:hypothetical protein
VIKILTKLLAAAALLGVAHAQEAHGISSDRREMLSPACIRPGFHRNDGLLHNVVMVTTTDHRETLDQYADRKKYDRYKVEASFKATGILNCSGMEATAQLTGSKKVLTTCAHAFFNDDCTLRKVSKCFFVLNGDSYVTRYPVDPDSLRSGGCPSHDRRKDWATIKLSTEVPGVAPYDYPQKDQPLVKNQPIVQVSARNINFKIGDTYPKTIEECFIRDIFDHATLPLLTDCNAGKWSSGAAQFVIDKFTGKTVIGAINVAESLVNPPQTGYDPDGLFNVSVPLSGKFLEALKENLK